MRIKCGNVTYLGLIHVDMWQKPTQHCKTIILQLKTNKFLNENKLNEEIKCSAQCPGYSKCSKVLIIIIPKGVQSSFLVVFKRVSVDFNSETFPLSHKKPHVGAEGRPGGLGGQGPEPASLPPSLPQGTSLQKAPRALLTWAGPAAPLRRPMRRVPWPGSTSGPPRLELKLVSVTSSSHNQFAESV